MLAYGRYGTRDFERAKGFYEALAAILGATRVIDRDDVVGYGTPGGAVLLIGTPFEGEASVGNGVQMSLAASSRAAVDAAHAKALELGGRDEGAPGMRGGEHGIYAAYVRDLDGNKLALFHFAGG